MKFDCKTSNIRAAISKVERVVSKQTTLPILGNVLISTENGRLVFTATNLEIAIKAYIGAKIEESGSLTIPARILAGFLVSIKDEVVSGEIKENTLEIKTKNHKMKILGIDAKDFPLIPKLPKKTFIKLKPQILSEAVSSLLTSVAHNDTRQELNGVYLKFEKDKLIFASTDSFRLSEVVMNLDKEGISEEYLAFIENNPSVILPALTFSELQRIINEDELEIVIDQNQFFVKTGSVKLISRIINGNYPEYRQILPKKYEINAILNKEEVLEALKISSLVANAATGGEVQLIAKSGNSLQISTQSTDAGTNISKIGAEINGPEFEVAFNCRYLIEGINNIMTESGKVVLQLNQQKSPVLIKEYLEDGKKRDGADYSYVIMPIIKN